MNEPHQPAQPQPEPHLIPMLRTPEIPRDERAEPQQSAVEWVNARIYPHGCDPSRPVVGLLSEEHALELAERCDAATAQRDQALADHRETLEELESCTVSLAAAQAENTRLRAALANSDQPCVYCTLPAGDTAKCASGFPGCGRMDDAMGCPELGASVQLAAARAEAGRFRAELENFINANPRKWEDQADQFEQWVKSRARAALEGQP